MSALPKSNSASLSASACAFLEARGLEADLCERVGLTSGHDQRGREWISIPYERNGVRVNRKFRAIDMKDFRQDKGGEQIFWRLDCLSDPALGDEPLIITEGEFDALAAMQAGYWRAVSVPGGAPSEVAKTPEEALESQKFAFLVDAMSQLDPVREIIIAADGDGPGSALRTELTRLLNPARCKFVIYPDGCKDLGDVLRVHGVEGVKAALSGARWANVAGVYTLDELPPLPALAVLRPEVVDAVDKLVPICMGHVSVWTGLAGDGKSTLVNAVMWTICDRYGLKMASAPFESTPQREYMEDLIAFRSGRAVGDQYSPATSADIAAARQWANDHIVFLYADGFAEPGKSEYIDATIDWFIGAATAAVVRHNCKIVVLDPWSQIDHDMDRAEREDQYVRRVLKRFKQFARTFDVHVAIVAHPAKPKRNSDGTYPIPEGYDISGASHWKNAPDLGVTVYRDPPMIDDPNNEGETIPDPKSTRVLVKVWKVKFHRSMNRTGEAYAAVDFRTGRYYSPEHWEERTFKKRFAEPQGRTDD